jgi:predicted Na+-dependent transporter
LITKINVAQNLEKGENLAIGISLLDCMPSGVQNSNTAVSCENTDLSISVTGEITEKSAELHPET